MYFYSHFATPVTLAIKMSFVSLLIGEQHMRFITIFIPVCFFPWFVFSFAFHSPSWFLLVRKRHVGTKSKVLQKLLGIRASSSLECFVGFLQAVSLHALACSLPNIMQKATCLRHHIFEWADLEFALLPQSSAGMDCFVLPRAVPHIQCFQSSSLSPIENKEGIKITGNDKNEQKN